MQGCLVGPEYHQPQATTEPAADSYKESTTQFPGASGWKVAQPQDAMLHGKWWEIFNDPELNSLEAQLDINNQNIKQFFQNLLASRALIAQARAQFFPTVTVGAQISKSQSPSNSGSSTAANGAVSNSTGSGKSSGRVNGFYSLPFDVTWEPDLWGRIQYAMRSAQYNAQVSAADLENERLTEQSSLAVLFFEIRGQDALQQYFNQTVEFDKKLLDITQTQYDVGTGDQISVIQAQNALQTAQSSALGIGLSRAQFEHAIAVLIGKDPSKFTLKPRPSLQPPPPIPVGVPSQLLERRPDIAAAERQVAADNAQIGIATAAYYPTVTLSAGAGFESGAFNSWFDWPSRFWSVGPSASYTLFDAGLRRATVDQFVATYNAHLAAYRQTVLTAFQQVEDELAAVRILSQQVEQETQAVESAQKTVELEWERYSSGVDPYIDFVTAENTLLVDQQSLMQLRIQESTSAVQLITALGGGWDRSQLPTTQEISKWPSEDERKIQN